MNKDSQELLLVISYMTNYSLSGNQVEPKIEFLMNGEKQTVLVLIFHVTRLQTFVSVLSTSKALASKI